MNFTFKNFNKMQLQSYVIPIVTFITKWSLLKQIYYYFKILTLNYLWKQWKKKKDKITKKKLRKNVNNLFECSKRRGETRGFIL